MLPRREAGATGCLVRRARGSQRTALRKQGTIGGCLVARSGTWKVPCASSEHEPVRAARPRAKGGPVQSAAPSQEDPAPTTRSPPNDTYRYPHTCDPPRVPFPCWRVNLVLLHLIRRSATSGDVGFRIGRGAASAIRRNESLTQGGFLGSSSSETHLGCHLLVLDPQSSNLIARKSFCEVQIAC